MKKLIIIPLGNVEREIAAHAGKELKNTYSSEIDEIEILGKIKLPENAFNPARNQYIASEILDFLRKKFPEQRVFGIASEDIYAYNMNFVFGLADIRRKAAMISIARLKHADKKIFLERVAKEAIHELGHVLGLMHCSNRSCVMSFSNSIYEVDIKGKELCDGCRKKLKA